MICQDILILKKFEKKYVPLNCHIVIVSLVASTKTCPSKVIIFSEYFNLIAYLNCNKNAWFWTIPIKYYVKKTILHSINTQTSIHLWKCNDIIAVNGWHSKSRCTFSRKVNLAANGSKRLRFWCWVFFKWLQMDSEYFFTFSPKDIAMDRYHSASCDND